MKYVVGTVIAMTMMFSGLANAGLILQPVSINGTNVGVVGGSLNNLIDQSGLDGSGVTGFDALVNVPHAGISSSNGAQIDIGSPGTAGRALTVGFGRDVTIQGAAIWGFVWQANLAGQQSFGLYADTDGDFTNGFSDFLGSLTDITNNTDADTASFTPYTTSFVHMVWTDQYNPAPIIGEIAFEQAEVPEPSALAILALGLIGISVRRKRKVA